ncbi:MAG: hypothetical protein GY767_08880 [Shimia sp.]|nr:hypothetical protein [Shimia sp.]
MQKISFWVKQSFAHLERLSAGIGQAHGKEDRLPKCKSSPDSRRRDFKRHNVQISLRLIRHASPAAIRPISNGMESRAAGNDLFPWRVPQEFQFIRIKTKIELFPELAPPVATSVTPVIIHERR